jgi:hypothetical protein
MFEIHSILQASLPIGGRVGNYIILFVVMQFILAVQEELKGLKGILMCSL